MWQHPWRHVSVDCLERRALLGTPIAEHVPDRLVSGCLAFVGDAAHVPTSMTGSGYSVSLEDAEAIAGAGTCGVPELEMERALERYDRMRPIRVRCSVQSGQQFSRSFAGRSGRPNKDLAELRCVDDCCRTARQARVSGCDQSAGLPFAAGTDPVHRFA
ncbi:hypothetical protein OG930_01820 [Streptomyces sp. NBC_01799]|nr:hypothetical protein OG930_01820 [Streptomyces sp. NBC_01799]